MEQREYRDVRVFRFKTVAMAVAQGEEARAVNPVPVFNDDHKLIGFADVQPGSALIVADVAIDPSTPERFDLETSGRKYWMDAIIEYRGMASSHSGREPTVLHVKALILTTEPVPGQNPLTIVQSAGEFA